MSGTARAGDVTVGRGEVTFAEKDNNSFPGSVRTLRALQTELANRPEAEHLVVTGHADDGGDPTFNLELSKRRVRGVARWLTEHGVAAERLELLACGQRYAASAEPGHSVRAARAKNRRVELQIVATTTSAAAHERCDAVEAE